MTYHSKRFSAMVHAASGGPRRSVLIALCLGLLAPAIARAEIRRKPGEAAVDPATKAVQDLRKNYQGLVVHYTGGVEKSTDPRNLPVLFEEVREDRKIQRLLRQDLVLVLELGVEEARKKYPEPPRAPGEKPDPARSTPATFEEAWGLVEGQPAVVLVDFREKVNLRVVEPDWSKSKYRRTLTRFLGIHRKRVALARKVEEVIEKAEYALKLDETRPAVLALRPWLEPKQRRLLDPVTLGKLERTTDKFLDRARDLIDEVLALEKKLEFPRALGKLEPIAPGYPFPEIQKEVARIRGRILRKINLGG